MLVLAASVAVGRAPPDWLVESAQRYPARRGVGSGQSWQSDIPHELAALSPLLFKPRADDAKLRAAAREANITVDVTPPVLDRTFGMVTVTVRNPVTSGPLAPNASHWVAVYSPASNADAPDEHAPALYAYCDFDPNYVYSGVAELHIGLPFMRADFAFVLFDCKIPSWGHEPGHCAPLAVAQRNVTYANPFVLSRPRVLPPLVPNATASIVWAASAAAVPYISFSSSPDGPFSTMVTATAITTYAKSDLCQSPAAGFGWRDPGLTLRADVALEPGRVWYYKLGDRGGAAVPPQVAGPWALRLPKPLPPGGAADCNYAVAVFGDAGRGPLGGPTDASYTWFDYGRPAVNLSRRLAAAVQSDGAGGGIDAVVHIGDISYAVGYQAIWEVFLEMVSPSPDDADRPVWGAASAVPYVVAVGNHESDVPDGRLPPGRAPSFYNWTDSGGECGVPTATYFPMPGGGVDRPWFSYDVGPFHFTIMSTEHPFTAGSPQHDWLAADLLAANTPQARAARPWLIFCGHRAMYIDSTWDAGADAPGNSPADQNVARLLRAHVEPLLLGAKVNAAFWGHNHVEQRTCAAQRGGCAARSRPDPDHPGFALYENPPAPVHFVVGTGGAGLSLNTNLSNPAVYTEGVIEDYGYAILSAVPADTEHPLRLNYKWVLSSTGEVLDEAEITQGDPLPPKPAPDRFAYDMVVIICVLAALLVVLGVWAFVTARRRPPPVGVKASAAWPAAEKGDAGVRGRLIPPPSAVDLVHSHSHADGGCCRMPALPAQLFSEEGLSTTPTAAGPPPTMRLQ